MGSELQLSISALAESIIIRNLSRPASADTGIGRTEVSTTFPLDTACRMLLLELKAGGLVQVFCASDGNFMVVVLDGVVIYCSFSE
jgi:hypothetical protein